MDSTTLAAFRHTLYTACFTRARDALFDLTDALVSDPQARSFVELSQAACFQRAWPSVYAALTDGQIDRAALQRLFADHLPSPMIGTRLVLGLDVSSILRPDAHTSADRTLVHRSNLPADATPVGPGWQFSALVVLPDPVSAATYILDTRRIPSTATATTIGATQLQAILPLLARYGVPVLLVLDRGYSHAPWVLACAGLPCACLSRARKDQVLYRPAPPPTQRRGRPRLDGPRFKGSVAHTHGDPDDDWIGTDAAGKRIQVSCWQHLHLKQARHIPITVIRVVREGARSTKRDPRVSWFWWIGGPMPPLAEIPQLYARRFGQEHGFRLDKQTLLWDAPQLRTPEQFERWTDVVGCAHNQLVLLHPLVHSGRRPWDRRTGTLSLGQVRRGAGKVFAQLGTPARPPQRRGKAPGRTAGTTVRRAPRHSVCICQSKS
ncbi:MAG: transposase [Verrucomicrobiae bacterium]|nr:transposase [Verrucomicrobiae bacterium]